MDAKSETLHWGFYLFIFERLLVYYYQAPLTDKAILYKKSFPASWLRVHYEDDTFKKSLMDRFF